MKTQGEEWRQLVPKVRVVRLSVPVQLLIPSLLISTISKSTRGISFYPGRTGFALGATMVVGSLVIASLLYGFWGLGGSFLVVWTIGTVGVAMMVSAFRPIAFVKTICTRCRLLPIIIEHEALHLSGIAGEKDVWDSMRTRYSVESLHLQGDPAICTFCPIPKRLARR